MNGFLFFLRKIKIYILPYTDIISWCLMPNHFHFMMLVNEVEIEIAETHPMTLSDAVTHPMTPSHRMSKK